MNWTLGAKGARFSRMFGSWLGRLGGVPLAGGALAAAVVGLLVATPRTLHPTYQYTLGEFASASVRAPADLSVPDPEATARLRDAAARHAPPVASHDVKPSSLAPVRVAEVFGRARALIGGVEAQRAMPDVEAAKLGTAARRRAQQARDRDTDRAVQATVQDMLAELERQLGTALTADERTLLDSGRFDRRLEDGLVALLREGYSRPIVRNLRPLREAAERSRRPGEQAPVVLRIGDPSVDRLLPDASVLDDVPGAAERIRARAPYLLSSLPEPEQAVLTALAARLVIADTALDEAASAERRARAAADVLPVSLNFRRNQLIVGEGREVTRETLLVLDFLRRQTLPGAFAGRAAGAAALMWVLFASLLWLPGRTGTPRVHARDGLFVLAAAVGTAAAFWVWLVVADGVSIRAPGVPRVALLLLCPLASAPMLAGLALSRRLTTGLSAAVAAGAGLLTDLGILFAAHTFVVGIVAAQLVSQCRRRSCVIRASAATGLAAAISGAGVALLAGSPAAVGDTLAAAAGAFLGAAGSGIVVLGLSRPLEYVFGYSTRLGLVELLSYDHPLLRRLLERAPGTFQHSVAVALLARTAAEAIGADALLVRVGALFHDIGKTERPEFFTENQHGENPHDRMPPSESARVILEHVGLGVNLLRRYRVGGRIADFAREHHGTGALGVFLQKARAAGEEPDPASYQYPGPRPRSKETAVLMMADRIEATARSRGSVTADEFRLVVDDTMQGLQAAGQFDEAPLTLRDLAALRAAFVTALADLRHRRVAYPAPTAGAAAASP